MVHIPKWEFWDVTPAQPPPHCAGPSASVRPSDLSAHSRPSWRHPWPRATEAATANGHHRAPPSCITFRRSQTMSSSRMTSLAICSPIFPPPSFTPWGNLSSNRRGIKSPSPCQPFRRLPRPLPTTPTPIKAPLWQNHLGKGFVTRINLSDSRWRENTINTHKYNTIFWSLSRSYYNLGSCISDTTRGLKPKLRFRR
jgi:hypothetical protein